MDNKDTKKHKLYWVIKQASTDEVLGETDRFESLENEPEEIKNQRFSYMDIKSPVEITFELKIDSPYILDTVEKLEKHIEQYPDGWVSNLADRVTTSLMEDVENEILKGIKK